MRALLAVVETLFPEPARAARPAPLLGPVAALGFAIAPLVVMIAAYAQTA